MATILVGFQIFGLPDFRSHSKSGAFATKLFLTISNPNVTRFWIPVHKDAEIENTLAIQIHKLFDFSPPLSPQKRFSLRTARYTAATKVFLVFETPFWERENGLLKGGSTFTDLNVKQIYYPQRGQNDNSSKYGIH